MEPHEATDAVVGLTLVSACFGAYDALHGPPEGHGFDDAVMVTDEPDRVPPGWRTMYVRAEGDPRLQAKGPKLTPWDYVGGDRWLWLDAACQIIDPGFSDWIDAHPAADLTAWAHPEPRDCLYAEATYCQDWPKYARWPIRKQTAHYRAMGMPEHFGLWACGALLWDDTDAARAFGEAWLHEQHAWSIQDQISLPFLLWYQPIDFRTFDAHEYVNPWLRWHPHLSTT